jgi:hypothetical protein
MTLLEIAEWHARIAMLEQDAQMRAFHQGAADTLRRLDARAPSPPRRHEWAFYMNGSFCTRCGAAIGDPTPCR